MNDRAPEHSAAPRGILRRLGPAGPLALVAAVMPAVGGFALLGSLTVVGPWLRAHESLGVGLYIAAFALLAGLALLPTYAQAILGGWAFGFAIGFPAALMGFFGGALIGYAIARRASGDRALQIINENPKWRAVRDTLVGGEHGPGFWRTFGVVTLLRLPPNSPFALTNLVMASVRVPPVPFMAGTLIGMAPRTAAAVYIAHSIQELTTAQLSEARPTWLIVAGIATTVAVIVVIGKAAARAIARATAPGAA